MVKKKLAKKLVQDSSIEGSAALRSALKLKNKEIDNFVKEDSFAKDKPITDWEKTNTLDC